MTKRKIKALVKNKRVFIEGFKDAHTRELSEKVLVALEACVV